jgi:hypothetical protein
MQISADGTTVTANGQTYRVGAPALPVALEACLPPIPATWHEIASPMRQIGVGRDYSRAYVSPQGLMVIISAAVQHDKQRWLHVSVSHRGGRLPNWREMCAVKDAFIGTDRTAYQVHPHQDKHISLHDKVLHLWCCLDGAVTPDFTRGGETI